MKNYINIFLAFILISCDSDDPTDQFIYDTSFELSIMDEEGHDLLNPESINSIDESEIKLFYLIEDEVIEVYDGMMDHPRNFLIYENKEEFRIRIFVNDADSEEFPITYIQWNEFDTDTLKCEISRTSNLVRIEKAWLNNQLIWPLGVGEKYYELIKE